MPESATTMGRAQWGKTSIRLLAGFWGGSERQLGAERLHGVAPFLFAGVTHVVVADQANGLGRTGTDTGRA
ncbi:hypothetical protein D3C71_1462500 [compost metagenome]